MVRVRIENKWFEICTRDRDHPYWDRQCDRNCPHWNLCQRGELIEVEMYLIVDADSIEELNKLAAELHNRGFKVSGKMEEVTEYVGV